MSAAEREAERRFPLWLPTGDYEIDREDYSELDAKWQNADTERERARFVQGAEWQAERDARVTDEMVEAGARALADWDGADWDRPEPEFDAHEVITKRAYRAGATAVLTSALGSRDADAPGDGSAT